MKTLVYIDNQGGKATKASLEAISYAIAFNGGNASEVTGMVFGSIETDANTSSCGLTQLINVPSVSDSASIAQYIVQYLSMSETRLFVSSHDNSGKEIAPRVAIAWDAPIISGVTQMAILNGNLSVKKNVFSGKAFGSVKVNTSKRIISLLPNSIQPEVTGSDCAVEEFSGNAGEAKVKVISIKKPEGEIPLPEAELVVSAGRGLKGPENWGIVEDLAKALGAATACSRPVSDIGWRPHHEHVGQTGIAIRPNLYIAAGISGAIQHLAGVNGSKVIVVINTDSEAPFFKAADYGIVGDAFEVLPRLTEAVKKFKASNH